MMVQSQKQSPAGHREIIRRWELFVRSHTPPWIPSPPPSPPTEPSRPHALLLLLLFPRTPAVQPDRAHGPTLVFLDVHYHNQLHSTTRISSLQFDNSNLKILISEFIYVPSPCGLIVTFAPPARPVPKSTRPIHPPQALRPCHRSRSYATATHPPPPPPRPSRRRAPPKASPPRGSQPVPNHQSPFCFHHPLAGVFFWVSVAAVSGGMAPALTHQFSAQLHGPQLL